MAIAFSNPIYVFARGKTPEIVIHGSTHFKVQGENPIGHEDFEFVVRDLLKPWQFLACEISGNENYWALGFASHSGESKHIESLQQFATALNSSESELFCPRRYPLNWDETTRLKILGGKPSRFFHPCSGKHLLMLGVCHEEGYPIDTYWEISHPVQKKVLNLVGKEAGEHIHWITDECGLPTAVMSSHTHMKMWERFALSDEEKQVQLKKLWVDNSELVGGTHRLETDLIKAADGQVIAKEGGDGIFMIQSLPVDDQPVASCLIKLASGYHHSHLALALWSVLSSKENLPTPLEKVCEYLRSNLSNWVPEQYDLHLPPFEKL